MTYYNRIETDLNLIISLAESNYKNEIISIYLQGSYGRKEGAFIKKNEIYYPVNDYDILIIVKNDFSQEMYNQFKLLVKDMLVDRLDVSIINISSFRKVKHTLSRYDLLMNSHLVYGDNNVLKSVNKFSQKKLPFREKEQLFFSRFISFFLFKYKKQNNKHYNIQQLSKSVISAYEALLIQNNNYSSSYVINRSIIGSQNNLSRKDKDLLEFLYEVKLNPSSINFDLINEEDVFDKSYSFVKSRFLMLIKNHNSFFNNYKLYIIYFWIRPRRVFQVFISILGNKLYFKDLLLIYAQLSIFINDFEVKKMNHLKKIIEIMFKQKFMNNDELVVFIINKRMGWE